MKNFIEQLIARAWNLAAGGRQRPVTSVGLALGHPILDGQLTRMVTTIPHLKRTEHIAILGKTGTGKSSLLRYMASQDIRNDRGFIYFDLHGDTTAYLIGLAAEEELRRRQDLSGKLIVIEPADPEYSIGLNVLERRGGQHSFLQIAEFAQILKQRWHLDSFGARTEELLRNSLHVLADNNLTLLELAPLLTNSPFRAACLRRATNPEVRDYFAIRYDQATEAMQATYREAILNKVSAFTADPQFRHVLGQQQSSFSLLSAIDEGYWIVLDLNKGRLGEQAITLGSLFLTKIKNALFSRQHRSLFTLYCDEIQNLVALDSGLDTLISEARKFAVSICSANQFLDQYPAHMRAAIMAVGTHIFFQLSSRDADSIASALDGGRTLEGLLKNLPPRQMVVKSGHHRWQQAQVPTIPVPKCDWRDLYGRCRNRWARRRSEIEEEIRRRHAVATRSSNEVLHDWE